MEMHLGNCDDAGYCFYNEQRVSEYDQEIPQPHTADNHYHREE